MRCRAHDYAHLIRRWRRVAARARLDMQEFSESGGYPIYRLASRRPDPTAVSIYFSAGIHGDEAAATEGLVTWAEENPDVLRRLRVLIFPCLNPWGLVNNSRLDARGRDLNRLYGKRRAPQIGHQIRAIGADTFDVAMTLHEDYDARGIYIYEVAAKKPFWAEELLAAAAAHLPPDPRKSIEGRRAKGGIVRRNITPDLMPDWPEAFVLHFSYARRTFTIETPSEFDLEARAAAQVAVIARAVELACGSPDPRSQPLAKLSKSGRL